MTDGLAARYAEIVAAVGEAADRIGTGHLTSHWPLVGRDFDRGVLVVGQAVHGWIPDWIAAEATTPQGVAAIVDDSAAVLADRPDPMSWIEGHRVHNSPFWRTAHEVVDALTPGSSPWYSRLAWANLYPIAPNDRPGNPQGVLRDVQTRPGAGFLDYLVSELDPRLVLVLAGPFIWSFWTAFDLERFDPVERPLLLAGSRHGREWLAGMHPGGVQRRGWPARRYAQIIIDQVRGADLPATGDRDGRRSEVVASDAKPTRGTP